MLCPYHSKYQRKGSPLKIAMERLLAVTLFSLASAVATLAGIFFIMGFSVEKGLKSMRCIGVVFNKVF